jgi:hypothetical protein
MISIQEKEALSVVLEEFGYTPNKCSVTPLGNGLINSTYLIKVNSKSFVLQHLNKHVFRSPAQVTNNADHISQHLKAKHDKNQYALQLIWQYQTKKKQNHVKINDEYWRSLHCIENCYTIETIENNDQAKLVANAFAQFTSALTDFDSQLLVDIIPDFHNLSARLAQLENAIDESSSKLIEQAQSTLDYIATQQCFCQDVATLIKQLPLRVTHNDTKINNLLFHSKTNKPVAVIDLDTCMSGYLMHDFGDMVRSCCSSISEDSAELADMSINFDILTALTDAYIAGFNGSLSEIEHKSLLFGVKLMPLMLGIRFLTDFLNGDKYFKTSYAIHNLVRAKNQLHMYKLLCQQDSLLAEIVLPTQVLNAIA